MRIRVESAEVATLKRDGRPWDGPERQRIAKEELAAFFALSLTRQLERLVATGAMPNPPDVFVRLYAGERLLLETTDDESFEPRWQDAIAEADGATPLRIEVWDRDLLFHDLIGATTAAPAPASDGRWQLGPFDQVRLLRLRVE
jgi:hypothetical protein